MPFLSMPDLKETEIGVFATSIIINYKADFFKDITSQIENITSETLLFLKNIENIIFEGFEEKDNINCIRKNINDDEITFTPKDHIKFKDREWLIFKEEGVLPTEYQDTDRNEKELYQIKIAIESNFNYSSSNLYSFFPTNIKLDQPYILHATFDLDATRNQLNNSTKNKFILERVVAFTLNVAKFYAKEISYIPLQILNHKHKADTLDNLGYYSMVEKTMREEAVFPCIDNTYKSLEEIIYISDEFAKMLILTKAQNVIGVHLLPLGENKLTDFSIHSKIDRSLTCLKDPATLLNSISENKLSINQRASLIYQVVKECAFIKNDSNYKLNLLINDNFDLIPGSEYIYTPITNDTNLLIPSYAKIQFVNRELHYKLSNQLGYSTKENTGRSRFFYDKLKGFCNIHSYEPTTLALKIISETNKFIKSGDSENSEIIKEMNRCMYHNFTCITDDSEKLPLTANVPAITQSGVIKSAEELSLSKFYTTGKLTAIIFKDIFTDDDFVGSPKVIGIENHEDIGLVERYLIWIGINKFVLYKSDIKTDVYNYFNYLKTKLDIVNTTGHNISYKNIKDFDKILNKISIYELIIWAHYDEILKKQLSDSSNEDVVKNFYRMYIPYYNKPSYIKYFLQKNFKINFQNWLIDDRYFWVNDFNIDYTHSSFLEAGLSKIKINEILLLFGAKDDFTNLPIDQVFEIVNKLPKHFPTGKRSQSFYKKALQHYKTNQVTFSKPLQLFADNGIELKLYPQEKIYFSDKIKLPRKLKKDFPIFNFPVRAGAAEAIKFFNINDLNIIEVNITSYVELPDISLEFNQYFDKIKPYILTHRLNTIEENKQRKVQASICNSTEFILCSEISYSVQNMNYEVSDYEFLHHSEHKYYVKVNYHDTLNTLRLNFNFSESFADIISLSFDVSSDKNDYKHILRNDIDYVEQSIKSDFGLDTLQEARELLGLTDFKQAFWQAVFLTKGLSYFEHVDDLTLEQLIYEKIGLNVNISEIDYEHIKHETQIKAFQSLFNQFEIELKDFIKYYPYEFSLYETHKKHLKSYLLSQKNIVKKSIWSDLLSRDIEFQADFLNKINKYEEIDEFIATQAKEFEKEFDIDFSSILNNYIIKQYGTLTLVEESDMEEIRQKNLKQFTTEEKYKISESERFKSLVYFPLALKTLKDELTSIQNEIEIIPVSQNEYSIRETQTEINPIIRSSDNLKYKKSKVLSTNRGVYTVPKIDSRKLKEIGNDSESIVYNFLLKNDGYHNVYLASEDNEGLHYDIRYNNNAGVIKYVEVKTFDKDHFHLSRDQFEFGKLHKDDFEIWLVKNKKDIYSIKDFFTNTKYQPIPDGYLVYLEV